MATTLAGAVISTIGMGLAWNSCRWRDALLVALVGFAVAVGSFALVIGNAILT